MTSRRKAVLLHGLTAAGGLAAALLLVGAVRAEAIPLLRPAPPAGYVAHRERHTTVYAPTDASAREGQQELRYARARFRTLFGAEGIDLVAVLADDPEHFRRIELKALRRRGGALLPFVTREHLDARAAEAEGRTQDAAADPAMTAVYRAASGKLAQVKPLAHEACHLYVAALAGEGGDAAPGSGRTYGHAALPDWFDESAATLCESPQGRGARLRFFRSNLDRRIPLREFSTMPHPLSPAEVLEQLGVDTSPGHTGVHFIPAEQARRVLPGTTTAMFYAQALSLGEFIRERGGQEGLSRLARSLSRGRTLNQALREVHRSAPGLPATIGELESEWMDWVMRQEIR